MEIPKLVRVEWRRWEIRTLVIALNFNNVPAILPDGWC